MRIAALMDPALFVGILIVIALILFMTEKIPLPTTALFVCISLYLSGILGSKDALKEFASENVMIIAGLGIIGDATFKTGAAAKIGVILKKFAKTERSFVFWLTVIAGIVSGFLSNNGAAALLIALTLGICASTGYRRNKLMFPITVGAILGGGMTTVGSNSTLYLKDALEKTTGESMAFFEMAPICLILIFVSALYFATLGFNLLPDKPRNPEFIADGGEMDFSKVPAWKPTLSVMILVLTVIAMYFEKEIGISVGFTALIGAFVVSATGLLKEKEVIKAIPMKAIILYACMVPLSAAIKNSGAGDMLAGMTQNVLGNTTSSMFVILFIFALLVPLTNFMSNSVTIIMFCPVAIAVAQTLGMDIKATLVAVRMAGTLGLATPLAWPGAAMSLEPGGYNFMDYLKSGIPLTLITIVVTIGYLYVAYPLF